MAVGYDICDPDPMITIAVDIILSNDPCSTVIQRVWQATDRCGNGASSEICSQMITILDTEAPQFTKPDDVTIECDEPLPMDQVVATDNCDDDPFLTYTDSERMGMCPELIIRTYYAEDDCGNSFSCTQRIYIDDTTPPEIDCPAHVTVECGDPTDPSATGTADASDNCQDPVPPFIPANIFINEIHYDNTGGDVDEMFEIAGESGVDLSSYEVHLYNGSNGTVYDVIALAGIVPNQGAGFGAVAFFLPANGLQNGAPDGLALVYVPDGTVLEFLSYEGDFTATAGPANGQTSTNIGVSENSGTAEGMSLQLVGENCGNGWTGPAASSPGLLNEGQDGCYVLVGGLAVFYNDDIEAVGCNERITRTWTAIDACGNTSACTQYIDIEDTTAPTITCPDDITLECGDIIPVTSANANDICDEDVEVTFEDSEAMGNCPQLIVRTFTAVDDCNNSTSCTQHIYIEDTTPPEIVCPADVTVECDDSTAPSNTGEATASDSCEPAVDPFDQPGIIVADAVFINEIHYDNAGGDVGEFVEVAGPAGTDLSNYSIVLYNGSNGTEYGTTALSGIIPDQLNGFGAVDFPIGGIQNGSPDGVALIYDDGAGEAEVVLEFLSYEGDFTATNGPANGLMSTDIGVSETSGTPAGSSLQLTGMDCGDTWVGPLTGSPGTLNEGQMCGMSAGGPRS